MNEVEQTEQNIESVLPTPKKSFFKRRKWWLIGGGVVLLLIIIGLASGGSQGPEYVTAEVERGALIQTVEASGELETLQDIDLAFESAGTVSNVYAEVGDAVVAGQALAVLSADDAVANLSRAQESVSLAQANIDQLLAGSTDEAIAAAQALVDAAQVDYDAAVTSKTIDIELALIALATASDNLDQANDDAAEDEVQVYDDLRNLLVANVIEIRSVLSDADEILGRENKSVNDDFDDFLSATDPQSLTDANNAYDSAANLRDEVEDLVYGLSSTSTYDELEAAAQDVEDALAMTSETLLYTRRVLDATTGLSDGLTPTELTTFKTTIDTARNTIQTEQETLTAQLQLIETTLILNESNLEDAQNAYSDALQDYDKAVITADASVAVAAATLAAREADLASAEAGPRSVDLAPYQAQLGQALADLDAASAQLAKTEIRAPIDGILTAMDVDAGEIVTAGTTIATVQTANEDEFHITVDVSESDIVKIDLDQEAEITFDAFGDDTVIKGRVVSIDPAEESIEGVVYYEVDVYLEESVAGQKPGMSADVTIITDEKDDVSYIPQRAVLEDEFGQKYVRVLEGDNIKEVSVVIGLRADGGFVEIITGLEEGQTIVTSIRD